MIYSLNAPVPGRVVRIASEMRPALATFESVRERHSLLVKRLGNENVDRIANRTRQLLAGTPPIRARIDGIGAFRDAPKGAAPVVYLSVDSPGLYEVHETLVEEFGAIEGLEGEGYVPHVTLARGSDDATTDRLLERTIEPVEWTITELEIYDASNAVAARRISLPA